MSVDSTLWKIQSCKGEQKITITITQLFLGSSTKFYWKFQSFF